MPVTCSRCSLVVKPVAAIDIDGTLGDYHGHLIEFAKQYLGKQFTALPELYGGTEPFREWFTRNFNCDVATFRDIKLAYRQGAQKRSMPCFNGAHELTQQLQDMGYEVWLATTRPWMRYDRIDPDTQFWLKQNAINYDYLLYGEDKYRQLADQVSPSRVVFVLEDEMEQYWNAHGIYGPMVPWLRRNFYNNHVDIPNVASDLSEACIHAEQAMSEWMGRSL